ncbi:MAG TPA: extracellular solute-binding protein [Pseudomonadales bacterium]|nr:extracellular solute-binding protein [Pseudomonadales bacterium]
MMLLFSLLLVSACQKHETANTQIIIQKNLAPYPVSTTPLPTDLQWQTNNSDPEFADPAARRGGTLREYVQSFPLTLRLVGPDSNGSFAGYMRALNMSLLDRHPNTLKPIPALATHWAFGHDHKTVYFRLDPDARWSDGEKVTADDYIFCLEFMRSKFIVAPFYNEHYSTQIVDVIKYDDYTIAVISANAKPDDELLMEQVNLNPVPRHFHKLTENWVRDYNWLPEPGTAAYKVADVRKGKYVEFERIANWWANDKPYYRHRFNPDRIHVKVIRDSNIAWQYFEKGELDGFSLTLPDFWHNKAKGELFDKGYLQKLWFYNDMPQSPQGLWLNMSTPPLDDSKVREAIAYAMDCDKVINTVLHGDYARLERLSVGYGEYDNDSIKPRNFDISHAVKLLEAAGWNTLDNDGIRMKNGQRLSLVLSYGRPEHTDRLSILKEEAKKAGIELQLQLLDSSAFFKQVLEKKHQIAALGWSSGGLSPEYRQFFHSENANKPQNNNIVNYADPAMDKLIEQYRAEFDKSVRVELAHQMEQKVYDSAAFIPLFKVPYFREAYWSWIKLPQDAALQSKYATRTSSSAIDAMGAGLFWIDVEEKNRIRDLRSTGKAYGPPVTIVDKTWQ